MIVHRRDTKQLTEPELRLLLDAQFAVVQAGGTLGLYSDMQFIVHHSLDAPSGILAIRPDDDGGIWIQLAFVVDEFRRRGIFREMVEHLISMSPSKRIGLATQITNWTMHTAANAIGFVQQIVYLYREPGPVPQRAIDDEAVKSGGPRW